MRRAVLVAAHLPAGAMQVAVPYDTLVAQPRLAALRDLTPRTTKLLGAAQVAAAVTLVAGRAPRRLRTLATTGLCLVQLGAAVAHARRRDWPTVPVNLALAATAAVDVTRCSTGGPVQLGIR